MRSAGVVLAAGSSRRMGSPKQMLAIARRPLLEVVVAPPNSTGSGEPRASSISELRSDALENYRLAR